MVDMEDPLASFLANYSAKPTVAMYRSIILNFLAFVYGGREPGQAARYAGELRSKGRDPQEDVMRYITASSGKAPKTLSVRLAVVRNFLAECGVELPSKFWKKAHRGWKGNRALTLDQPPTVEELRRILAHLRLPYRAAFLMMLSSGMRVGEARQLRISDINMAKSPPPIRIRGAYTKTGNSRVAFISREAKEALEEWLKVRDAYIEAASHRGGKRPLKPGEDRIFPVEYTSFFDSWKRALIKAGLADRDSQTRMRLRHIHTLRKFFRTQFGSASNQVPPDVTEALMGHEEHLARVYAKYSSDQLAEFYTKGEPTVTVFGDAKELAAMKVQVEHGQRELEKIVVDQAGRLQKMESQLEDLTAIVKATRIESVGKKGGG